MKNYSVIIFLVLFIFISCNPDDNNKNDKDLNGDIDDIAIFDSDSVVDEVELDIVPELDDDYPAIDDHENIHDEDVDEGPILKTCEGASIKDEDDLEKFKDCEKVIGDIKITYSELVNLKGLESIVEVTGSISFNENRYLVDISEFENLKIVGGDFILLRTVTIPIIDGLNKLEQVGGKFEINSNPELERIIGFKSLKTVGGDFWITKNEKLPRCFAQSLRDQVELKGKEIIAFNSTGRCDWCRYETIEKDVVVITAEDLTQLKDVGTVIGNITIDESDIENLTNLECLRTVEGNLTITSNENLIDITALHEIESIAGDFSATDNENLPECQFDWLYKRVVGGTEITTGNNPTCDDECGWKVHVGNVEIIGQSEINKEDYKFKSIIGKLSIKENSFETLESLECISYIEGTIVVMENMELINLKGLENLLFVGKMSSDALTYISIFDNPKLIDLSHLKARMFMAQLSIGNNAQTIEKSMLLSKFNGDISFYRKDDYDVQDLSNLTHVGGDLKIIENPALVSLSGLENLIQVDGHIEIQDNPELDREEIHRILKDVKTHGMRYTYHNKPKETTPPTTTTDLLIVVESSIYSDISDSLIQYQNDLTTDGYTSTITTFSTGDFYDLKDVIKQEYDSEGIQGAFLIGELPAPLVDQADIGIYGREQLPFDIFLMDMDGHWSDTDSDGYLDYHSTPDVEIFVSRLPGTVEDINFYFEKNHKYRTDGHLIDPSAFIIIDDSWQPAPAHKYHLDTIYSDLTIYDTPENTTRSYYVDFLTNEGAEFVYQETHSGVDSISFIQEEGEGKVLYDEIISLNVKGSFWALVNCSASRYNEESFIASAYLHSEFGLATIGSTIPFAVLGNIFIEEISLNSLNWGESYENWFNVFGYDNDSDNLGTVIMGDPLLVVTGD